MADQVSVTTKDGGTLASTTDTLEQLNAAVEGAPAEPAKETAAAESAKEPEKKEGIAAEGETEKAKPKKESSIERRIRQLAEEKHALQERIKALEESAAAKESAKPKADDEPVPAKFETYELYLAAHEKWAYNKLRAEEKENETKAAQAEAEAKESERQKKVFDTFNERIETFREETPDYDEVVGIDIEIPTVVKLAIVEMENGPQVAYHLGKNPDLAEKLMQMTPIQSVIEIGRIARELAPVKNQEKAGGTKKPVSKAASPISPVGGGSTGSTVNIDEMSYQDYKAHRERERSVN